MRRRLVQAAGVVGGGAGVVNLLNRASSSFCLAKDGRGRWRIGRRAGCFQILTYHRVNPTRSPFAIDVVRPEVFEAQMRQLVRHWDVRALEEIVQRVREGLPIPPGCIAVTFDDGYADNHEYARPILQAHGVKATFFLTTGHVGTGRPLWFDEVLDAFAKTRKESVGLTCLSGPLPLRTEQERVGAAFEVLRILRTAGLAELSIALTELFAALDVERRGDDGGAMLSWSQVRDLVRDGHGVGSHTVSHAVLSRLRLEEIEHEIVASKRTIEHEVGQRVTMFAYPSGRLCDYDAKLGRTLMDAGYRAAVRNVAFSANTADTDLFQLARLRPWEEDVQSFRAKLCFYRVLDLPAVAG